MTKGERLLVEYFKEMTGDFYTLFFRTAFQADSTNLSRLEEGFSEEISALRSYRGEDGYWQKLVEEYDNEKLIEK